MARVGVWVCHCGSNIEGTVNTAKVAEAAAKMPHVVFATHYMYMCSTPGQDMIQEKIREHNLDRVVVASCSPRMHERTFRKAAAAAGVNPYLCEMANIREHVSWVHKDVEVGTQKAIDLVRMTVAKVLRDEPLYPKSVGVTRRALVIGGGVTGIHVALDIANAGYPVVIVEREPSIGGVMAKLDKTFPTLDCSACILTPRMVDAAQHPNIKLMTYSEVADVKGFVGNFTVQIRKKARKIDESTCTGCGTCWNKCPQKKIPSEFDEGLGMRTAIYVPFPQAVPLRPVIDTEHCTYFQTGKCRACEKLCPTGSIRFDQEDEIVTEDFGAIVVANGFGLFDHSAYGEYGYGRHKDVITGLQLERLLNASGPTGGVVTRPSDGKHAKRVVMISCVGSRDEKMGRPYCSKICCMYSAKHAIMLREHDPEVKVYNFYMDIRAGGKSYEEFTRRAIEDYDATYIRGRVSEIYELDGKLIVKGADTLMGVPVEIEADLVVLATGMTSAKGAAELAQTMNISYDGYGFINEAHVKLQPVESNTDGIFLAGTTTGPKDIPDCVAQAGAAAAKALSVLTKETLVSEPTTSFVDEKECVGCFLCRDVCPYKAIDEAVTRAGKAVARVNESVCKGCGLCVNVCRGGAISLRGFTDQQLLGMVEAYLRRGKESPVTAEKASD